MIFGQLFKKGRLDTAPGGAVVILNDEKVSYPVNKADAAIWRQCTGITYPELLDTISSKLGWQMPNHVNSHIERFVNWCIWAKLIEVRDFTPEHFAELMRQNELDKEASSKLESTLQTGNKS